MDATLWGRGEGAPDGQVFQENLNESERILNCTVKDHDLHLLISFDCRDDLVRLRKHLRTEDVERRVVKCDSPILGRVLGYAYLVFFVAA